VDDILHYIKKIKFSSDNRANCVNAILAVGQVCFALCVKFAGMQVEDKLKIYESLVKLMGEV
jgi:hypothetical protein